jgi:hypothetical protein
MEAAPPRQNKYKDSAASLAALRKAEPLIPMLGVQNTLI